MRIEKKSKLVSVIVASYNHAEYLAQRMESLISQTYQNLEILVIDDCSSDNSVGILRQYESHSKVKLVVREKNGGWVTVSNQGIEMSSGEFVIFANCDDDCDPRLIERLVDAFETFPSAGLAFCRSLLVDEDNKVLGDDYRIRESSFRKRCVFDTLLRRSEMSRYLLKSCVIPNLSAALFRKDYFVSCGGLSASYSVCSDWDLFFKITTHCDVAYVATPLNRFRQHATTIRSSTKERVVYEEYFRLLLGQIRTLDLSLIESCRFRLHVMYLWSTHLLVSSWGGVRNFPYHFSRVCRLDFVSLLFLVPAIIFRLCKIVMMFLWRPSAARSQ